MNNDERKISILKKLKIESLWHITHKDNLENILKYGILSRNLVEEKNINFTDIADHNVLQRRSYENYALLFFTKDTPMLHVVKKKYGGDIILLMIDPKVMLKEGVKFSDGNLACYDSVIYENLEDLYKIDWGTVNSKFSKRTPCCFK